MIMVEIKERQTEIIETVESPHNYVHPVMVEEKDLSQLKKRVFNARDYAYAVAFRHPTLLKTENISKFIEEVKRQGCSLPDRSIDRAIRLVKQNLRGAGCNIDDEAVERMEADHRMVFGGLR